MGVYGVDDSSHEDREDDVAIEVASLGDGAGHDGGAGGGEGALEEHEGVVPQLQANQAEVCVANELRSSTEGKGIAKQEKWSSPCEELGKISTARIDVNMMESPDTIC